MSICGILLSVVWLSRVFLWGFLWLRAMFERRIESLHVLAAVGDTIVAYAVSVLWNLRELDAVAVTLTFASSSSTVASFTSGRHLLRPRRTIVDARQPEHRRGSARSGSRPEVKEISQMGCTAKTDR